MIIIINLKMNSGFFKTEDYILLIEENRLVMSSKEYENIYILIEDIREFNLIVKGFNLIDFEINTGEKNYTGRLENITNFGKLIVYFKNIFGDKLKVEII